MYRYETHMHTFPVSRCGRATVEETLAYYKELGYDGVFVTNHFLDGNINVDKTLPYEEKLQFYFSDYEKALEVGQQIGLKVFLGVELSFAGTDFLVYGLDKEWYFAHPEMMDMDKSQELAFLMESGALVIQAHPYREAGYIDHIRLFPRCVQGVEIINATCTAEANRMAEVYRGNYDLLPFAGSDNHRAAGQAALAGLCFVEPICTEQDFVERVKAGQAEIFTIGME